MRTIKFRAWDKVKKEIVRVETIFSEEIDVRNEKKKGWFIEKDYEKMQFTGLFDKNGKEIYEGDIIALQGVDDDKCYFYEIRQEKSGAWMGCNELYWDLKSDDFIKLEVVGNIHENPELLKTK